jgi:protein-S-isoprenylcysteine O-methyltransferase Ste14
VNHHLFNFLSVMVQILWLIFLLYWAVSAVGVKKPVPGKGSWKGWARARLALALILVAFYKLPIFSPFWHFAYGLAFFNNGAVRIAGAVLTVCGITFAVWARRHLGSNWSGRATMKIGHELVTSGPYHFVRHPIYTGVLTALFGSGLVNGPIWMVVFFVSAFIFTWRIGVEETYMMELFPDQYAAYRARTKALIPALW